MANLTVFFRRLPIRSWTLIRLVFLTVFSLVSKRNLAQKSDLPLFSLTSHRHRVKFSWMAIASIWFAGVPLSNIAIWLPLESKIPKMLKLLGRKGLNVRLVEDMRSHTKWVYCQRGALSESFHGCVLVDDDLVYPLAWIKGLLLAIEERPDQVIVSFSSRIQFVQGEAVFAPAPARDDIKSTINISNLNHPFSGSGMYIPKTTLKSLDSNPENFLAVCPTSDDIWLHREIYRLGGSIWSLDASREMPPSNPLMGGSGLHEVNWNQGQNSVQLINAFKGLDPKMP